MATTPEKLLDLGDGLEIWRVSPLSLRERDKNARVESPKVFRSLVRNIKKRKAMESLPFVARREMEFEIISGHHRIRAAIQAGLPSIVVLADASPMTRSELIAKQVAHNSINGRDDPAVLLQLLQEIEDVGGLIEAAVDQRSLEKALKIDTAIPDVAADFDWKTLTWTFLPTHVADLERLALAVATADLVGVAGLDAYEPFMATMRRLGRTEDIRSVGALVYRMMELTKAHLDRGDATGKETAAVKAPEEAPTDDDAWVSLAMILGRVTVPEPVAKLLSAVVKQMLAAGDVTEDTRWQVLEFLAADYLAGVMPRAVPAGAEAPAQGDVG